MQRSWSKRGSFWIVQLAVVASFTLAWTRGGMGSAPSLRLSKNLADTVPVPRGQPLRIEPLYDDPQIVSDDELAAVLKQVLPRFAEKELKPNFIEHALRIWGVNATFRGKGVMSGVEMRDFLIDHGQYLARWGDKVQPLLQETEGRVSIRWGSEECASVHHDHWLACLTEADISLHEPVYLPSQHIKTINDVLQQALRDFRPDEREVEWSAMAFGLWIPPAKTWRGSDGRELSFDMLARRLMRGAKRFGVCSGTHRIYSLMLLVRLDDEFSILSPEMRLESLAHLKAVRQLLIDSQFEDGHWPSDWERGADAVKKPIDDPLHKKVIATGHHLEWLAIAPEELHPPREQIRKAARWAIDTTVSKKPEEIAPHFTFYSHIGNALATWRKTRPPEFWSRWEAEHSAAAEE